MKSPKVIKTPFPKEKYAEYVKLVGASKEPFSVEQIKQILVIAIKEFEKGTISSDQLSSIGNALFQNLVKDKDPHGDSELFGAVLAASELSFYIRKPKFEKQFMDFLNEVIVFKKKFNNSS